MSFQLTIAEGKERGKEFVFDQTSVVIGRTSDCDVILYDPGVSRKHARIYAEGPAWMVEDMGSSNGTKVNGNQVKKQKLADGDALSLGPVVFEFSSRVIDGLDEEDAAEPGIADQSTRIVAAGSLKRQRNKGEAMLPKDAGAEQVKGLQRASTQTMEAVSRARVPSSLNNPAVGRAGTPPGASRRVAANESIAPAKPSTPVRRPSMEDAAPVRRSVSGEAASRAPVRTARSGGEPAAAGRLTAAERARIKRESKGMLANLRIFWAEASTNVRRGVFAGAGLFGLLLVAALFWVVIGGDGRKVPDHPEPATLDRQPLADSFGLGDDVQWLRADMKVFGFQFNAPVRAVVLIHFQAKDIAQGEVMVTVNGADVGLVPPDTMQAGEKSHEVIVPPQALKKGQLNQVIFDNTRNPPGKETWKIWNVWIETALLPEIPPDQLLAEAKSSFARATKAFDNKDIGAVNRYEAWREYRNAWLMLEAHPEPKPELYLLARDKVKEAQQELDRTCSKLLLEVQRQLNLRDWTGARSTLDFVSEYFPSTDQTCNLRAEQLRYEHNL